MRVLAVLPCRFWGGPERQTLQLALWLRENRNVDTIFAVMPPESNGAEQNPLLLRARQAGFEAELFLQKRRYDLLEGFRVLRGLVSSHRPDLICATGYKADLLTSRIRDVPTVAMLRGFTSQDAKVRFYEWLDRKSLPHHDSIIVVSKALRERLLQEGMAPDKLFWVPNAIDVDTLPPRKPREDLCKEIGADSTRPLVGAVGRLSPEKGQRILLQAFHTVQCSIPRAQLVLVGDGPEESALRRQALDLGLSAVAFAGLRQDGQQIIGALDVLALPSLSEGMPNVVLEAFAYGTPLVATAVGGVPEMVSDQSGWLVAPGHPAKLAAALMQALEDRQEAERRSRNARSVLAQSFTVEKQGLAWLRAVEPALNSLSAS
jgi:glycosyltransferase involved in cell wall biosynthesis